MRAIDHAVETILAPNSLPNLDALAEAALRVFAARLAISRERDPSDRMQCLGAAWMAHAGSYHIEWGLSHQMGRQLGPRFDIPHGFTSAILLPAVVELETAHKVEAEARVAAVLGVEPGHAAGALKSLAEQLSLPTSLRAAGIEDRAAVEDLFAGNGSALAVVAAAW